MTRAHRANNSRYSSSERPAISPRSWPEQKAGPRPASTTTCTAGSAATRTSASSSSASSDCDRALRRSGRFRVRRATGPSVSTRSPAAGLLVEGCIRRLASLPRLVPLGLALAADSQGVALAVRRHRQPDRLALAFRVTVGYVLRVGILLGADLDVAVELVDRLNLRRAAQGRGHGRHAPLLGAVVEYRHARADCVDEHRVVADVQAVVRHLVH